MILSAVINRTVLIYPLKMFSSVIDICTLRKEAVSLFFEGSGA